MREPAPLRARDADRDRDLREPLRLPSPVQHLDPSAFVVGVVVVARDLLIEALDDRVGHEGRRRGRHHEHEIVAAEVPDERVLRREVRQHGLGQLADVADHVVAAREAVVVVECFEVVDVGIEQRELRPGGHLELDLLLDADVPGQPGQRRLVLHLLRATQDPADPGQQLRGVERLDDVVVRADREALELVGREPARGEDDHRDRRGSRVLAEQARELEAVDVRHHHVGHDQVGRVRPDQVERLLPVVRDPDPIAGRGELDLEETRDERVVIDDEQLLATARLRPALDLAHARASPHPPSADASAAYRPDLSGRGTMNAGRAGRIAADAGAGHVPRRDGQHAARPAPSPDARDAAHGPREARDAESGRLGEGPDRDPDDRGRRAPGPAASGRHDRGADLRQHGSRSRDRRRDQGLPLHLRDAGQDEPGEDRAPSRLRGRGRDLPDGGPPRLPGVVLLGLRPPRPGDPRRVPAEPVLQPGQSRRRTRRRPDRRSGRRPTGRSTCSWRGSERAARSPASRGTSSA